MPTVEERLAALEKQMAAWIDQQPTTYYTHQYSGEEIDAAVGRALTGGALDTSVGNVSKELGTFVRPNLLDNWYFGNPVDQRKGKIIPAGKSYYTTPDITLPEVGKTDKAYTVIEIKNYSGYGQRATISIGGTVYYVWDQDAVRGYPGNWYTVDRWKLNIGEAVTLEDGCICLKKSGTYWGEYFDDFDQFIGMTLTGSVLLSDGTLRTGSFVYNGLLNQGQTFFSSELGFYIQRLSDSLTQCEINSLVDNVKIKAAKLEISPAQTLAHQENGVWVLNEVPDYGEQLRRCQRYFIYFTKFTSISGRAANTNSCQFVVPIPVTLRDKPVISDTNVANWRVQDVAGKYITITGIHAYPAGVQPSYITIFVDSAAAFTTGAIYTLTRTDASGPVSFSADL